MGIKVIGATLRLDGEKDFNLAVSNCNKSLKEMESAMKLVKAETATNANSLDSLKKRNEALNNVLEARKNKESELQRILKEVKQDHSDIGIAVKAMQERYDSATESLKKMRASGEASEEEIEEQEKTVAKYNKELEKQKEAYEKSGNKVKEWQTKLNTASAAVKDADRELQENSRYLEEADAAADDCAKSIDNFGKKTAVANSEVQSMQLTMQRQIIANNVIQNLEKASAAVRKLSGEVLTVTNAYENGAAKVATIADSGAVPLAQLKNSMLELSTETGRSIDEITEATYQAISASVDTADAVGFVKNATSLAKAGFLETADSVDVLTTIINAYKMSASDAETISDKLVQTQNKGKTTVNELSQSMGQVIPLAAAYNVNLDNLSTSYIELTKNGIGTAEAGTMLKGMFSELAKDGTKVSGILREKTGKSFGELMNEGQSLGDVLNVLYESVEGNSEAFANLWSNVRARTGALSLAQTGAEAFNSELQAMADSTGNVASALEKLDTPSVKANKAMNALKNAGATLGDSFMGAAAPALEAAAKAVQNFTKWIDGLTPELKTVIGVGGGAIALLATATPKILAVRNTLQSFKAIREATRTINQLKAAMTAETAAAKGATAAQEGLNAAQAANPIGIVALAVTGLVAALWGLDKAYKAAQAAANPYHEDLVNLQERHKELRQEIENTRSTFDEQMSASGVDATLATNLKQELDELMAVEDKDVATKEKIKTVISELNNTVPGLALAYDAESDSLNKTNSEIEKSIELMEQQLKLEAYREGWLDTLQQQAQAEKDLAEAKELVMKMTEGASDATRQALETSVKQGENLYYSAGLWAKLNDEIGEGKWQADELTEAVRLLNSAQDDYNDITEQSRWYSDQYSSSMEDMGDAAETAAGNVDDAAGSMDEMSAAAYEAAAEIGDASDEIIQAYDQLYDAARQSIDSQIGLFEDMSGQADITAEDISNALTEMDAAFETQKQALSQYADNIDEAMAYVAESGDSNAAAFVSSIADMGEDGAVYMAAFVEAIRKADGSAEQMLANFADAEQAKDHLAKTMAEMSLVTQQEAGEMTKSLQGEKKAMTTAAGENAKAAVNKTLEFKEQFLDSGQKSGQQYAGGIGSQTAAVTGAAVSLKSAAGSLQYSDAYTWGAHLGGDFAGGIRSKTGDVANAAKDLASAASDYLHHTTPKKGELHGDDKWGEELVNNIAKGMNRKTGEVTTAAKNLAKHLTKEIKSYKLGSYGTAVYTKTAEDRIDKITKVNNLTLIQEQKFWEAIKKRAKKGTAEYKTAAKALNSVKKELKTESSSLTKDLISEVKSSTKEMNSQIREIRSTLKNDREAVREELKQNIKDLRQTYKDAVAARQEAIKGSLSLFDKSSIQQEAAYQKKSYTKILQMQVEQLREREKLMSSLSGKIKNSGLMEELESLGTDQIAVLQQFDSMTKKELERYEKLYRQRETLTARAAKTENETLLKETDNQIAALRKAAQKEEKALNATADKQIKALKKSTEKQLEKLRATYMKNMKKLGADGKKQGKTVGSMVAKGIGDGFKAGMQNTNKDLRKQLQSMLKTIKTELKIKSPSAVLRDEVGQNMAKGIGVGFVDQMRAVEREMQAAIPTSFEAAADTALAAGTGADSRIINEVRIYLGEKDVTDLLTRKIVKKITADTANYRISKGAQAYV